MAWIWLNSEYGGETHAFDVDAGVEHTSLPYLQAPCEHTAPPRVLHRHVNGRPICVACLIAVGATIPAEEAWRQ